MLEEIVCLLYFVLVLCLALSSGGCEGVRGASSRRRSGEGSLRGGAPGAGGQRRSEATTSRSSRNRALQGLIRRRRRSLENQTEDP